jgi:hypothetical protein
MARGGRPRFLGILSDLLQQPDAQGLLGVELAAGGQPPHRAAPPTLLWQPDGGTAGPERVVGSSRPYARDRSVSIAKLKALRFSGRFRPMTSTWLSRSSVTVSRFGSWAVITWVKPLRQ